MTDTKESLRKAALRLARSDGTSQVDVQRIPPETEHLLLRIATRVSRRDVGWECNLHCSYPSDVVLIIDERTHTAAPKTFVISRVEVGRFSLGRLCDGEDFADLGGALTEDEILALLPLRRLH